MNTARDLSKRLLKLFPANILREEFEEVGSVADSVETISSDYTARQIKDFARRCFFSTKQHVYVFDLDAPFNHNALQWTDLPLTLDHHELVQGEHRYFCFAEVTYDVVLVDPLETVSLSFMQPVMIRANGQRVIIHFTILEKNIRTYFPENRGAMRRTQQDHETESITLLTIFFQGAYIIQPTDLNQGVKRVWDDDWIDCKLLKYRKSRSMSSEAMDENATVKQSYPELYEELHDKPLEKTTFKYLRADEFFCDHFSVDPNAGIIKVSIFPDHPQQVINVVARILQFN